MARQSGPRARIRSVLIVEEDAAMRAVFAAVFEDEGIQVVTAASRAEAEDILFRQRIFIAALVIDMGLGVPGDGERLLVRVANMEAPPATVLLSALRSRVQPLASEYGIPFLVKPFDLGVFHAAVVAALDNNLRPRHRVA